MFLFLGVNCDTTLMFLYAKKGNELYSYGISLFASR